MGLQQSTKQDPCRSSCIRWIRVHTHVLYPELATLLHMAVQTHVLYPKLATLLHMADAVKSDDRLIRAFASGILFEAPQFLSLPAQSKAKALTAGHAARVPRALKNVVFKIMIITAEAVWHASTIRLYAVKRDHLAWHAATCTFRQAPSYDCSSLSSRHAACHTLIIPILS